jgi:uncharacterized protein YlaI
MEIKCSECHKVLEVYDWEAISYKLDTKEQTTFICMPPQTTLHLYSAGGAKRN